MGTLVEARSHWWWNTEGLKQWHHEQLCKSQDLNKVSSIKKKKWAGQELQGGRKWRDRVGRADGVFSLFNSFKGLRKRWRKHRPCSEVSGCLASLLGGLTAPHSSPHMEDVG